MNKVQGLYKPKPNAQYLSTLSMRRDLKWFNLMIKASIREFSILKRRLSFQRKDRKSMKDSKDKNQLLGKSLTNQNPSKWIGFYYLVWIGLCSNKDRIKKNKVKKGNL